MYRKIATLIIACLVSLSANAARTLEILEGSYEAVLQNVTFPASIAGTLIARDCLSCDGSSYQVDSSTTYTGSNGQAMSLQEFNANVAELRELPGANASTAVAIYYSLDTNRITRVALYLDVFSD